MNNKNNRKRRSASKVIGSVNPIMSQDELEKVLLSMKKCDGTRVCTQVEKNGERYFEFTRQGITDAVSSQLS